jgi:hypothetical protein
LQKYQFQQELIQAPILHIGIFLLLPERLEQRDQQALMERLDQLERQELQEPMVLQGQQVSKEILAQQVQQD